MKNAIVKTSRSPRKAIWRLPFGVLQQIRDRDAFNSILVSWRVGMVCFSGIIRGGQRIRSPQGLA
jgi:hypothetical protein